jgi:hypothetical protein
MIDDKFIFAENPSKRQTNKVVKTQVTTNHIATKYLKPTLDVGTQEAPDWRSEGIQNELGAEDAQRLRELEAQVKGSQSRVKQLETTVASSGEIDAIAFEFDKQLLQLQSKLDTFNALVDFERNIDLSSSSVNESKQAGIITSMTFFDPEDISNLTKLPLKASDLSSLVEKYENEQHYLESLNLRQVVSDVFRTLENSLANVNEYLGQIDSVREGAFDFNYDFVQSVS